MSAGGFGLGLPERLTPSVARFFLLAQLLKEKLRVALPGMVESFNPELATVTVQIATNEYDLVSSAGAVAPQTELTQISILTDVPVALLGGGGYTATFPIQKGDECIVLFTDTALDVWLQNGGTNNNPITQRRHSLSDAVAFVGIRSYPRSLSGYSTDSTQLRSDDGETYIDLKNDHVTVHATNVNVDCTDCTVTASDAVTVNGANQVTIESSTQINITGGTIDISGSSVTIGSSSTIDGKNFLSHKHTGVQTGGGTTGPVL